MIHLQIQQGILGPYGKVQPNSVSWKPVSDFDVEHSRSDIDYHKLDINNRGIYLGNTIGIENWGTAIVTGVEFQVSFGGLHINVLRSSFSFATGKLLTEVESNYRAYYMVVLFYTMARVQFCLKCTYIFQMHSPKIVLRNLNVPTEITRMEPAGTDFLMKLEFTGAPGTGARYESDPSQITIPFLDAQDVAPEPAMPLSWINMNYKRDQESAGFIAIGVFTYDYNIEL